MLVFNILCMHNDKTDRIQISEQNHRKKLSKTPYKTFVSHKLITVNPLRERNESFHETQSIS